MSLDLVIGDAALQPGNPRQDVGISQGRIAAIEPQIVADAPRIDAKGRLLTAGLVECHIHLDKAGILDQVTIAEGTLNEAIRETAQAKSRFTEEDVYRRAAKVVEAAILAGTVAMRSFVEIDPRAGLRSFHALKAVRHDYRASIDLQLCAFVQEGLTNEPETEALIRAALADGADLVGGCTYTDPNPEEHVARIFALADEFGVAVDFHTDFDLDPEGAHLPLIIAEAKRRRFRRPIACGHVTKLAASPAQTVDSIASELADAGIATIALPATDLFLLGRNAGGLVPRGIAPLMQLRRAGATTAVATNNVLNPFTPYGDANLMRIANLYANVAQLSRDQDLDAAFDMIGKDAARAMGRSYGLEPGAPADLVLFDATSPSDAVRRVAAPIMGWKAGVKTFERPAAQLLALPG
jgi:cytosine/creatinine deaminase